MIEYEDGVKDGRLVALEEILQVIEDMEKSYAETGRKVSKGDIIKWIRYELGLKTGRT